MKYLLILAFCFLTFISTDGKQQYIESTTVINIVDIGWSRVVNVDDHDESIFTYENFRILEERLGKCPH